ncbi:MAG: PAAR domain-containing protein [Anaerolineae bacterium]
MPPAARLGDMIQAVDIHTVMIPTPGGPVPTPLPHPFLAAITLNCSTNVLIGGAPAATLGSQAVMVHVPQGGPFQVPPTGIGQVVMGSTTVLINGKPAARMGDTCNTCQDAGPAPLGRILPPCAPTVIIGG